jgi:hypothetical protein
VQLRLPPLSAPFSLSAVRGFGRAVTVTVLVGAGFGFLVTLTLTVFVAVAVTVTVPTGSSAASINVSEETRYAGKNPPVSSLDWIDPRGHPISRRYGPLAWGC